MLPIFHGKHRVFQNKIRKKILDNLQKMDEELKITAVVGPMVVATEKKIEEKLGGKTSAEPIR